jgi:hypothetical protein
MIRKQEYYELRRKNQGRARCDNKSTKVTQKFQKKNIIKVRVMDDVGRNWKNEIRRVRLGKSIGRRHDENKRKQPRAEVV